MLVLFYSTHIGAWCATPAAAGVDQPMARRPHARCSCPSQSYPALSLNLSQRAAPSAAVDIRIRNSVFFYLARQTEGAVVTWLTAAHDAAVGGAGGMPDGLSVFGKYIFSLYWSAVTFATVG